MKAYFTSFFLFLAMAPFAQSVEEMKAELSKLLIRDSTFAKVEDLSKRILAEDPYNDTAVGYLSTLYERRGQDSLFNYFFDAMIAGDPENPAVYLLAIRHRYGFDRWKDSAVFVPLKKLHELEPSNQMALWNLGYVYYNFFHKSVNPEPSERSHFYARQSLGYLEKMVLLDSLNLIDKKYVLGQLSHFLGDSIRAFEYEHASVPLRYDDRGIPPQGFYYFPRDRFVSFPEGWPSDYQTDYFRKISLAMWTPGNASYVLRALEEPIWCSRQTDTLYRFTWLRTFHAPIAIRIEKSTGPAVLFWKVSDGQAGYDLGKVVVDESRELSHSEWQSFSNLVQGANIWQMATDTTDTINGEVVVMADGAKWIMEGVRDEQYHVVMRESGRFKPAFEELCLFMLALTGVEVPEDDIY